VPLNRSRSVGPKCLVADLREHFSEVEALPSAEKDGGKALQGYIKSYFSGKMENHYQELPKTFGPDAWQKNVYAYLRSKDSLDHECNVLATPLTKRESVVNVLTFVELMHKH
jgi:hypothetical protein